MYIMQSICNVMERTGHPHLLLFQDSVASVLATLGSEGAKKSQNRASLREAQRAVLMCPGSAEAWAMLVAARVAAGHAQVGEQESCII